MAVSRTRALAVVAIGVCVLAAHAAAAPPPSLSVVSAPRSIALGEVWTATLRATGKAAPVVAARPGATTVQARATRLRPARCRVRLRLTAVGPWSLGDARRTALPSRHRERDEPSAVPDRQSRAADRRPDGSLLVAERSVKAILMIDPVRGGVGRLREGGDRNRRGASASTPTARCSCRAPAGSIASARIAGRHASPTSASHRSPSSPAAQSAFANESSVGVVPPGGGPPRFLAAQVGFAHGLVPLQTAARRQRHREQPRAEGRSRRLGRRP